MHFVIVVHKWSKWLISWLFRSQIVVEIYMNRYSVELAALWAIHSE